MSPVEKVLHLRKAIELTRLDITAMELAIQAEVADMARKGDPVAVIVRYTGLSQQAVNGYLRAAQRRGLLNAPELPRCGRCRLLEHTAEECDNNAASVALRRLDVL